MKYINMHWQRVLLIAALSLGAATAYAGAKFTGDYHVKISLSANGSGSASGYMGHIYNGDGTTEVIYCQRTSWANVRPTLATCWAHDEAGATAFCRITSEFIVDALDMISPDARLYFRWNSSGECISISVTQSSEFEDKKN